MEAKYNIGDILKFHSAYGNPDFHYLILDITEVKLESGVAKGITAKAYTMLDLKCGNIDKSVVALMDRMVGIEVIA